MDTIYIEYSNVKNIQISLIQQTVSITNNLLIYYKSILIRNLLEAY
jgi:hypothetical protein